MSTTREPRAVFQPNVVVVGGGLIGLTCATAIAREGLRVLVISSNERGTASGASAGILGPRVGPASPPVRALGIAARDMYPDYVDALWSRTEVRVPLDSSGVLEVALDDRSAEAIRSNLEEGSEWLDATALADVEPLLAPAVGAAFHPFDGAVDSVALLTAVRIDAARDHRISLSDGRVTRIEPGRRRITVEVEGGWRLEAPNVVLASGAWVASIAGLPRPLPVVPVRGQMLSFAGTPTRHVVMGAGGYVVPRGNLSLVGSTMEGVGFDAGTTAGGAALLGEVARHLAPALCGQPVMAHWAGLRPVTPDLLPIVGADPDWEGLFYACGHSKNGVLLAALTAQVIADLVSRGTTSVDVAPYSPGRFDMSR